MKKIITLLLAMIIFTSCSGENIEKISKASNEDTSIVSSDTTSTETECSTTTEITTITTVESQEAETSTTEEPINTEMLLEKWKNEIDKIKSDENVADFIPPSFVKMDDYVIAVYRLEDDMFTRVYCIMNNEKFIHIDCDCCGHIAIAIENNNIYIYGQGLINGYEKFCLDVFDLSTSQLIGYCLIIYSAGHPETEQVVNTDFEEVNSLEDLQKYIKNISDNWVDAED